VPREWPGCRDGTPVPSASEAASNNTQKNIFKSV